MFAAITPNGLTLLDPSVLKRLPPGFISPTTYLRSTPFASTWAADNSALYVSQEDGIYKYETSGACIGKSFENLSHKPITVLVSKDHNLILASDNEIYQVELGSESEPSNVSQTFDTHTLPINSLSLSNDSTILASTSSETVQIHNLTSTSQSTLRGLPSGQIHTCTFHAHTRTRLLIAVASHLVVYDVTRPSNPARTIALEKDKTDFGNVASIACSPFSKTLVAVGFSSGIIGLVDLEKEKGLFRTLNLRVPLTSLAFSAEGASIYAGTENGKLLILDLRALDKPPKSLSLCENDQPVISLAVQRKLKPGNKSPESNKPLSTHDINKAASSRRLAATASADKKTSSSTSRRPLSVVSPPRTTGTTTPGKIRSTVTTTAFTGTSKPPAVRARTVSAIASPSARDKLTAAITRPATVAGKAPTVRISPTITRSISGGGATSTTRKTSPSRKVSEKSPLSPPREKLNVSVNADSLLSLPKAKKENLSPSPTPVTRTRKVSTASSVGVSPPSNVRMRKISTTSTNPSPRQSLVSNATTRTRTISTTSRTSASTATARTRTTSMTSSLAPTARPTMATHKPKTLSRKSSSISNNGGGNSLEDVSPIPPVPSLPNVEQLTAIRLLMSPSPELPMIDMNNIPTTPLPPSRRAKGKAKATLENTGAAGTRENNVLGLGTPDIEKWVQAGDIEREREGRKVGFVEQKDEKDEEVGNNQDGDEEDEIGEAKIEMTVQISPRRPPTSSSTWKVPVPSPLRHSTTASSPPQAGPSSSSSAQDLLQTLIQNALYDFRRETKNEIIGLHLDLVKMGRGWKQEMNQVVEMLGDELREAREENRRLREENERLKRGF
ncbi:hypothetical protein C8Q75DRAFT_868447 [Abortiporus biennis]|nr:hypothetical protein C8Q75DRAFT_868447 [Abortiporus biennis]